MLSGPAHAEQLFVRNHPFKGNVAGTGHQLTASLPDLAAALGWKMEASAGHTSVLAPGYPADTSTEAGVWVNGTAVASTPDGQVNVEEFARAAGLRFSLNKELGTVDLNLGQGRTTPMLGSAVAPPVASDGKPIELNLNTPGAYIDLQTLPVAGKLTFILLWSPDIRDPNYVKIPYQIDVLAKNPEVVFYKINAGSANSAFSQAYHYRCTSPMMLFYSKNRGYYSLTGGHHLRTEVIEHTDEFVRGQLETIKQPHLMTGKFGDPRLQHF